MTWISVLFFFYIRICILGLSQKNKSDAERAYEAKGEWSQQMPTCGVRNAHNSISRVPENCLLSKRERERETRSHGPRWRCRIGPPLSLSTRSLVLSDGGMKLWSCKKTAALITQNHTEIFFFGFMEAKIGHVLIASEVCHDEAPTSLSEAIDEGPRYKDFTFHHRQNLSSGLATPSMITREQALLPGLSLLLHSYLNSMTRYYQINFKPQVPLICNWCRKRGRALFTSSFTEPRLRTPYMVMWLQNRDCSWVIQIISILCVLNCHQTHLEYTTFFQAPKL